jgi:predicted transcriptional regulator
MSGEKNLYVVESAERPCELPTSMSVHEALQTVSQAGLAAAIVIDHGRPIGIVTADTLSASELATPDATVDQVMDYEAVHVARGCNVEDTMRAFRTAAWHSLWRRRPFARGTDV